MATFVPDELIYETDLSTKRSRNFTAVMGLIDVSRLFDLYEKHVSAANGGSYALFALLNKYLSIIIEQVYANQGDVLKFSRTYSNAFLSFESTETSRRPKAWGCWSCGRQTRTNSSPACCAMWFSAGRSSRRLCPRWRWRILRRKVPRDVTSPKLIGIRLIDPTVSQWTWQYRRAKSPSL